LEVDAGILRRGFFGFEQGPQRATEIATREFYPRPEQLAASRVRFLPVRDGAKQTLGLCQVAALEITTPQLLQESIFPRSPPNDFLQERASRFRLALPE
jgi:hypothetical protein